MPQEIFDSQEYSIKLLQIPKVSNTNRGDLAVEFVKWDSLDEDDKNSYKQITTIIKDKIVKQQVVNLYLQKPSGVIAAVKEKTGIELSISNHTDLWKAFRIRPDKNSEDRFDTNTLFCLYDEPHNDFLYTQEWIDFIIQLINKYGFTKNNIHEKCRDFLSIDDYR